MACSCSERVYNFSAGPAVLPLKVLEEAQRDLICYPGAGASIMELSHRGKVLDAIFKDAEARMLRLIGAPEGYHVLFLQGGATTQFSMVPMNFLGEHGAVYIEEGTWSKKAAAEAKKCGKVDMAWSGKEGNYSHIPADSEYTIRADADYFHYTSNETIHGIEFHHIPDTHGVPIVCDMSSDFLSKPFDVTKYGLIYAGAQKNIGPAGVTVVIISDEFYKRAIPNDKLPIMLDIHTAVENRSLYNTCPVWGIYIIDLVLKWIEEDMGGLKGVEKNNIVKAQYIYDAIDSSDGYYKPHSDKESRSLMNITWNMATEELEKTFIAEAAEAGFASLKGHRSIGGLRASVYNAFPVEGAEKLAQFMAEFKKKH